MKWVPPPQGWFKAKVDGAIFKETNKAGIGVVVHDSQGWVLAIKALAIRWAIRFAIKTSFSCVIIESDSLSVVKAIQDTVETTCPIGHIIDDMKHLSMAMKSCEFYHTKREANQVAHTLARNDIHFDTEIAWLEEIPLCVSVVIQNDVVFACFSFCLFY